MTLRPGRTLTFRSRVSVMSSTGDGFTISPEDAAELVNFQISKYVTSFSGRAADRAYCVLSVVANCAVLSIFGEHPCRSCE